MIKPTIHLNGTHPQDLADGYVAALRAVNDAIDAVSNVEFNARDYYVHGPDAWKQAVKEMRERVVVLEKLSAEFLDLASHCQDAADEREARSKAAAERGRV